VRDPCTLFVAGQASALNGVVYKSSGAEPPIGGLSMCSWDNATAEASVEVGFGFWPDPTAAQAGYDAALAETANKTRLAMTPVRGLGDSAGIAQAPPAPNHASVGWIFVRRGALVVALGYYGGAAPTEAAFKDAVARVVAELPVAP
jgi:hypothetical protein